MLVSEMLERSVEESREKHAAVRSGCSTVNHTVILAACVMCVSVLVSEMLKRSVEESREKRTAVRSEVQYSESYSDPCSVCDV